MYNIVFFPPFLSSHFTGVRIAEYCYCKVVKKHVTISQMKITWADATPTHRCGFASGADADTRADHSGDRNTALLLVSSHVKLCMSVPCAA